jgi:hypothetical protein
MQSPGPYVTPPFSTLPSAVAVADSSSSALSSASSCTGHHIQHYDNAPDKQTTCQVLQIVAVL